MYCFYNKDKGIVVIYKLEIYYTYIKLLKKAEIFRVISPLGGENRVDNFYFVLNKFSKCFTISMGFFY